MKLISHRGNVSGKNSCLENNPHSIEMALRVGFHCEVDIWVQSGNLVHLGHDFPIYEITNSFLLKHAPYLWIHCKNIEALLYMKGVLPDLNYFFHNNDDVVLTSQGFLWHYPNRPPYSHKSICVLPEWGDGYSEIPSGVYGVCSDYVGLMNGQ